MEISADPEASPAQIFDSGIFVSVKENNRLIFPKSNSFAEELPANKQMGDVITVLLVSVEGTLTIVPGEGGSMVGSDTIASGSQRIIYIRFTSMNRGEEKYVIY